MGELYQTSISTLHDLKTKSTKKLEDEIRKFSKERPIALVLPTIYSEIKGEAFKGIIETLKEVDYLNEIVVTLGGKRNGNPLTQQDFYDVKKFVSQLSSDIPVIWNTGERIEGLYKVLEDEGLEVGEDGKGRSAWMAYGYILSGKGKKLRKTRKKKESEIIALHDCDILTYDRRLLAKLVYPTVNPEIDKVFCKGYYPRYTNKFHGRVVRLFVVPFIKVLKEAAIEKGNKDAYNFCEYMSGFMYPLAGEFSMNVDLARRMRIPGDWGLEVGVLAEVYDKEGIEGVIQVDLTDKYEHKHQEIDHKDPEKNLGKMAIDIAMSLMRSLSNLKMEFPKETVNMLRIAYRKTVQDYLERYRHDAILNGLSYDQHDEQLTADVFEKGIGIAGDAIFDDPTEKKPIPNWNRVIAAIPLFFNSLYKAVLKDNK